MNVLLKIIFLLAVDRTVSITTEKLFTSKRNTTYYIEKELKYDWFESFAKCACMNMSLVAFDSQVKWDDVHALILKEFGTSLSAWTSGYAVGEKRQFLWMSTGEEFTYTSWAVGNPDFVGEKEYCVQIAFSLHNFHWNDNMCTKKFGFICEFKPQHCHEFNASVVPKYQISFNNYQVT